MSVSADDIFNRNILYCKSISPLSNFESSIDLIETFCIVNISEALIKLSSFFI